MPEHSSPTAALTPDPRDTARDVPAAALSQTATEYELRAAIEHAAHLLPSQGPITVFVHHNTLHAFEHMQFDKGVTAGGRTFGCDPFLPEDTYRQKLAEGRIRVEDLRAVLLDDLGENADGLLATFGTRYGLRLAMLEFPLRTGTAAELRWVIAETDALRRFRSEVASETRSEMISGTRRWVLRNQQTSGAVRDERTGPVLKKVYEHFDGDSAKSWSEQTWEAFVLNFLWRVCHNGVAAVYAAGQRSESGIDVRGDDSHPLQNQSPEGQRRAAGPDHGFGTTERHRDLLLAATGMDTDQLVHEVLIGFCAGFLDQGFARWTLPNREAGLYASFLSLYTQSFIPPTRRLSDLRREVCRLQASATTPLESINESLRLLGVSAEEREDYIVQTVLALRGWAGMIWQMETNAEWAVHQAPKGCLVDFLAVRLILDRLAVQHVAGEMHCGDVPLDRVRETAIQHHRTVEPDAMDQQAFLVFQLAQVRGWEPEYLLQLSPEQWAVLIEEIGAFGELERRRIYHHAFERKYHNETLDAVIIHSARRRAKATGDHDSGADGAASRPAFQVVCCIDDREESFRRHLEEVDPECETFGVAGFFGVAMYYHGIADAHYKPLCPVVIKPKHYVCEDSLFSMEESSRLQAEARRQIGRVTHRAHVGTRSLVGGLLTGLLGSLAAVPLVARILFPRTTARIRRIANRIVTPAATELRLERIPADPGSDDGEVGYTVAEMADIVAGTLRLMGLTRTFSPLVLICGHGSGSLNNPHESAYNCGACSGSRGGPNARAFAQMANDPRVRRILEQNNIHVPDDVHFVGAYHNTCDDSVTWFDVDRVPVTHRQLLQRLKTAIDAAREHNAHERCRRFESASLRLTPEEALRHVEARSEDLSQARPEYNHATNALCFVGRRDWSRGLFLDRRAFLASYDPTQDDEQASILERLLQAAVPVCAGINLEYYHSTVDVEGYGCGSKLPHNITSLLGVMTGAASDLRPGLSAQMVEIHEPVRLMFVIETTLTAMQRIIDANPGIAQLVRGEWVRLAVFDYETSTIHRYHEGRFVPYQPESSELPIVSMSSDWYRGCRDHLGFASIVEAEEEPSVSLPATVAAHVSGETSHS